MLLVQVRKRGYSFEGMIEIHGLFLLAEGDMFDLVKHYILMTCMNKFMFNVQ